MSDLETFQCRVQMFPYLENRWPNRFFILILFDRTRSELQNSNQNYSVLSKNQQFARYRYMGRVIENFLRVLSSSDWRSRQFSMSSNEKY